MRTGVCQLLEVDSLRSLVASLRDGLRRRVRPSYQDLSRRNIAELYKPRIRLPSLVGFVGVGLVVGRVLRRGGLIAC